MNRKIGFPIAIASPSSDTISGGRGSPRVPTPAAMLPALVREVNRVDPDVPIAETIRLPLQMAGLIRPLRISATFIGYAAALAGSQQSTVDSQPTVQSTVSQQLSTATVD